jgi:pimeloyl-ACP methyl ester carboxylesterase
MRLVSANGLSFACLEDGRGPLVLLLHGFPDTAHTWDDAMPALVAAGYRVVAPFMRGYHPTSIPDDGDYTTAALGKDVVALISALADERAIVIGHDWGASAAYAAATLAPERVSLLVTVAIPHPRSIRLTPRTAWRYRHFLPLRRTDAPGRLAGNDFAYLDKLVRRWSPAWDPPVAAMARVKELFRDHLDSFNAALGYYRAGRPPRVPPPLQMPITVPTVAFAGTSDGTARPSDFEKARACFAESYEVVEVPGGHFLHREHPDTFERELLRVLAEHNVRGGA